MDSTQVLFPTPRSSHSSEAEVVVADSLEVSVPTLVVSGVATARSQPEVSLPRQWPDLPWRPILVPAQPRTPLISCTCWEEHPHSNKVPSLRHLSRQRRRRTTGEGRCSLSRRRKHVS